EGPVDGPHLGRTGPQCGCKKRHDRDAQVRTEKGCKADQAKQQKRGNVMRTFRHEQLSPVKLSEFHFCSTFEPAFCQTGIGVATVFTPKARNKKTGAPTGAPK